MQGYLTSKLLVEQHLHGCFGVDFNKSEANEINYLAKRLLKHGIGGFFPTILTDTVENIRRQIAQIKKAKSMEGAEDAEILGIHIEGLFLNPEKKGIHDEKLFLKPNVENFKLIEDDMIKIVTLAPELDEGLCDYLRTKGIKVQAGHCVGGDLTKADGTTHTFNAMGAVNHRTVQTALSALIDDKIYTEIIADGVHLCDEIVELIFKSKPHDKIILVSDCLPIAHSELEEADFAGQRIYFDGKKATSKDGTIAGSTLLLDEIIKRLKDLSLIDNVYNYHGINLSGKVFWDKDFNVVAVEKNDTVICRND